MTRGRVFSDGNFETLLKQLAQMGLNAHIREH